MSGEFDRESRVQYCEGATFVRRCVKCNRFVSAPKLMLFDHNGQPRENQAHCSQCGPTDMIFEGYI